MSPESPPQGLRAAAAISLFLTLFTPWGFADGPLREFDLRAEPQPNTYSRVFGLLGTGRFGIPVCGGHDCDGDGFADFAFASMTAKPFLPNDLGVSGMVTLVFGRGSFGESFGTSGSRLLFILGISLNEVAGSEIWMDDVNGDGLGDLLIGRQNLSPEPSRRGAGAVSIVLGGPHLRGVDDAKLLLNADEDYPIVHVLGARAYDRLGVWMRTGDVDGDCIADMALSADEADGPNNQRNRGEVYLIKGGDHLSTSKIIDLALFPETDLGAPIARITPPPVAFDYHFGATLQIGDLNGNGRAELLVAATIERIGAGIRLPNSPVGTGQNDAGPPGGHAFILWDDHFTPDLWVEGYQLDLTGVDPNTTIITGGPDNTKLGEEILAVPDCNGDGKADLFLGDLGGAGMNGVRSGLSYILYNAESLRGRSFNISNPPATLDVTTVHGPRPQALSGDTAVAADLNGDGLAEIVIGNPHDSPNGRISAGSLSVLYGRRGPWPEKIDLAEGKWPPAHVLVTAQVIGAFGTGADLGDTLGYSMAAADLDGDRQLDVITNEMLGNGAANDVGNLVAISGRSLFPLDAPIEPEILVHSLNADGEASFLFRSRADHRYRLERSVDLENWEIIGGPSDGNPGTSLLTAPAGSDLVRAFFRIAGELL